VSRIVAVISSSPATRSGGPTGDDYWLAKYASSVPVPARLGFQRVNTQLVLSWTNPVFHLQAAPRLTATFTNVPGASSPYTNTASGPQQFFRLSSQ
jgi:hypothetical protein